MLTSRNHLDTLRDQLAAYMAKRGLRSTEQRRLIIETFFHAPSHITIEDLLGQVRSADSRVGYATVYRTLKLLAESGVASERQFGDGVTRYELADAEVHHDHLICTECRSVTEFEDPRISAAEGEVARRHGFDLRSHRHELFGVCAQCQRRKPRARN